MEKTVEIKGIPVFYRDKGEGDTILILHGWNTSSESWIHVQENLTREGFRVIVPDLPGFGDTFVLEKPWDLEDYISFIRSFMQVLGISPKAIVGHSSGGRIAFFYTMKYGNDLPALVLCNATTFFRYSKIRVFLYGFFTSFYDLVMQASLLVITGSKGNSRATKKTLRETFKLVTQKPMRPYLTDITTPTLILYGEKDHQVPISDARIMEEEIAGSRLVMLPKVGHNIHSRMPEEVARQISSFLKDPTTQNGHVEAP